MKSIEELLQEAIDNNHEPHIIQNLRLVNKKTKLFAGVILASL